MKRILTVTFALLALIGWQLPAQTTTQIVDTTTITGQLPVMDYSAPQDYIVSKINIIGVKYLDTNVLRNTIGFSRGDTIQMPGSYISQAISKLWKTHFFSDVQIIAHPDNGYVNLDIYLKERPRIYRWEFTGVRKSEAKELGERLKLKRGSELSEYGIDKNKLLIRGFLAEKGFRNAEVEVRIKNDSVINNAVNLTFVIDKKDKVRIGEIDFEGNEVFTDGRLRRTFKKLHPVSWKFFQNNKFKEEDFETDKENLLDFYNSKGYRNANILSDSIWDINAKRIGIRLTLDEGNKYYFRNISWIGNSVYDTRDLEQLLGIKKGDTYDRKLLQSRLGVGKNDNPENETVQSLYQNNGYLRSMIDPAEVIVGEDSIDLEIKIYEGKQFRINDVNIHGNNRVNDEVIRRELYTLPGDLYNRALIMRTIYQLGNMQLFNAEKIAPDIQPVTNELVDISWNLEEQASDRIEISGGWGAGMFVGSVGIQLNNISLQNFFKKGAWRPYPQGQNQQLQISAQSNGTYYKAFSLSFTEPWLGGKKPHSLTVSAYYSDETDAYYAWQEGNAHFRTLGVAVGIGRRLNWPDQYFTLYNELSYQRYKLKDWDNFVISNGSSNIISLRTVFGRNSVDQQLYPRKGSDISLSLTLTPPYSLFDGIDYNDPNLSDNKKYKWIEYHKWLLKARFFQPLSRNSKLVLMARMEMGYLGSYNSSKLSPFEGFSLGGDGLTGYNVYGVDVIGLRGYKDGALNPTESTAMNDYARVYNKYTLELRYPLLLQSSTIIYGLVFAEAGNAFSSWKKFDPFRLKRAAGAGIRVYLPIVGMLGVDWGYGFDVPPGETKPNGSKFSFSIGTEF